MIFGARKLKSLTISEMKTMIAMIFGVAFSLRRLIFALASRLKLICDGCSTRKIGFFNIKKLTENGLI